MRRTKIFRKSTFIILAVFALQFFFNIPLAIMQGVFAADLTEASVRLDRTDVSHVADATDPILVILKPASTATEENIFITFGAGFTVDGTASNITSDTDCVPTTYQGESVTDVPGLPTAATAVSGQNVTFEETTSMDLTAGTLYGFCIDGGITNPSSAGEEEITIATRTSADAEIDSKTVAVDIVTDGSDLVTVDANVVPTFNFALSGNTIDLGDLSTSAVTTGNITVDIDTNAGNGWIAWTKSANAGLDSASTSDAIDTQGSVDGSPESPWTSGEFYQLDIQITNGAGTGTPAIEGEYDGNSTDSGGTFSSSYTEIATSDGPGTNDGITFTVIAAADTANEAADDYTDTLTVVGAGSF